MSTEREYEAGADGMNGAGGAPGTGPNVYHPQPAPAPAYEQYADPAAAHGWQNAYDATRELPALREADEAHGASGTDGGHETAQPVAVPGAGDRAEVTLPAGPVMATGVPGGGRAGRRRAARRAGGRRRVAVVAGVLGVAGAVAGFAALGGSGSPSGARPEDGGSANVDSAPASPRGDTGSPSVGAAGAGDPVPSRSATSSDAGTVRDTNGGTTDGPAATTTPSAPGVSPSGAPTRTTTPTPTVTASSGAPTSSPSVTPGRGHGHGHGTTKRPR
ncbi:hypothetical protein [Streptomyces sp. NPDC017673]|uniref:hypothetical protein n=1 Tax=unclassified Streptomyces TaxID=2593676 RepID=UPI003790089E